MKLKNLMKNLGIEVFDHCVMATDVYDILTNEDKLQNVLRILKIKAFW